MDQAIVLHVVFFVFISAVVAAIAVLATVYCMEKRSSKGYEELADAWRRQAAINDQRLKACEKQLEMYQNAILSATDTIRHGDKCAFLELKDSLDKLDRIAACSFDDTEIR